MDTRHYDALLLSALLHDIHIISENTLAQQISETSTSCPELDLPLLTQLVTLNEDDELSRLLLDANDIVGMSPGTRIFDRPLTSVLSRIILDTDDKTPPHRVYPQTPWSTVTDDVFPVPDSIQGKGQEILKRFIRQWLTFFEAAENFNALYAGTLSLIEEHLWCIPAHREHSDVPLAEILRLKSAVAACLFRRHIEQHAADDPPFTLLAGDLSGIQKYVFGITEGGQAKSGAGKRLRARSLFVQLLAEVGMQKALQVYQLPPANILMASGGKFHILWPRMTDNASNIDALRREFEDWLITELHGEIGLALASAPVSETDLQQDFGTVITQVEEELFQEKRRKFTTLLQSQQSWDEEAFLLRQVKFPFGDCPSCRKFPRQSQDELCRHCSLDKKIGTVLARHPGWLAFYDQKPAGVDNLLPVLGKYVAVYTERKNIAETAYLLLQLGGAVNGSDMPATIPALWRPPAPHVTDKDFSELAKGSGRELLGYVKADVDRLGKILQWGFKRCNSPHFDTATRFSALSRQFDRFFGAWLGQHLKQRYPDSYTVFAGGDDLFVIGRWDTMLKFVNELHQQFRKFAGENPFVTLSAGVALVKPRYPLGQAAGYVEDVLEMAKQTPAKDRQDATGRNQIALLGDVLTWKDYQMVLEEQEKLLHDQPHSAFLYHLLQYAHMWREFMRGDTSGLRFQPYLAYNITRNVSQKAYPRLHDWAKRLTRVVLDQEAKEVLNHLGCIATLSIFAQQSRKE